MLQNHAKMRPPLHVSFYNSAAMLDHLSKICMILFDQVTKDAKSIFTFESRPLVAELKCKMAQFENYTYF